MKVYWRDTDSSFFIEEIEVDLSEVPEEEKSKEASDIRKVISFNFTKLRKILTAGYRHTTSYYTGGRSLKSALTCPTWTEGRATCRFLNWDRSTLLSGPVRRKSLCKGNRGYT